MKIGYTAVEMDEGKAKYHDENLIALEEKDKPKKVTPFFAEFIKEEFVHCDAIVVTKENILDLLIHDMDKLETRMERVSDDKEKSLLAACLEKLEGDIPLCDMDLNSDEIKLLELADPFSLKPVVQIEGSEDVNEIISLTLDKTNQMFFYTSGPTESHAWLVDKGSDIVTCAGKIHTDLARGFIKGDVVPFEDYMSHHNFNDCKSKGVAKLVERDYIVQPGEVIEIRFNV